MREGDQGDQVMHPHPIDWARRLRVGQPWTDPRVEGGGRGDSHRPLLRRAPDDRPPAVTSQARRTGRVQGNDRDGDSEADDDPGGARVDREIRVHHRAESQRPSHDDDAVDAPRRRAPPSQHTCDIGQGADPHERGLLRTAQVVDEVVQTGRRDLPDRVPVRLLPDGGPLRSPPPRGETGWGRGELTPLPEPALGIARCRLERAAAQHRR